MGKSEYCRQKLLEMISDGEEKRVAEFAQTENGTVVKGQLEILERRGKLRLTEENGHLEIEKVNSN